MTGFDFVVLAILAVSGVLGLVRGLLKEVLSLVAYLLAFFDPRARYYVFSRSDPRPWLRDMVQIVRKAVRREKP